MMEASRLALGRLPSAAVVQRQLGDGYRRDASSMISASLAVCIAAILDPIRSAAARSGSSAAKLITNLPIERRPRSERPSSPIAHVHPKRSRPRQGLP